MTKIINLKTGRVREHPTKVHSACSLCHCAFVHEDEGGVVGGVVGGGVIKQKGVIRQG